MNRTLLALALALFVVGRISADTPDPISKLQAAVDRNPSDAGAWLTLARAFEEAGREADAIRAYGRAQSKPEAREAMARLLRFDAPAKAADHLGAAAEQYERAADRVQADRCLRELVKRRAATGSPDGAIAALKSLLDRDPPDPKLAAELPELFEHCGRPAALYEKLASFAERVLNAPGAIVALADADAARGNIRAAEVRLQRVLAKTPDAAAYRSLARLWEASPQRLLQLVNQLQKNNSPRARALVEGFRREPQAAAALMPLAVRLLEQSSQDVEFDPCQLILELAEGSDRLESAEIVLKQWQFLLSWKVYGALLRVYELRGKLAEIDALARRGLAAPGKTSEMVFHHYRTRALMHLDQEKDALASADAAIKISTDKSRLQDRLAKIDVLAWFGRIDEAKDAARTVLEEFPDAKSEREARLRLASVAEHAGDNVLAEAHLERVLELAPDNVTAHNDLGYYWAERGRRLVDAERLCRFAVEHGRPATEFDPGGDDASYRDSLGWVLFRRGRLIAARMELERALELPGGRRHAVIWDHLGDVLAAQGKLPDARAAWTEALARVESSRRSRDDARPAELRRKLNIDDRRMKE